MADQETLHARKVSLGIAVVNGFFNGLLAGVMMALYLVLVVQLVEGSGWAYMGYLDIMLRDTPWQAVLIHLTISATYGVIYTLLLRLTRLDQQNLMPRWLAGLSFGMLLWLMNFAWILPKDSLILGPLPSGYLLFAFMIYGLVLGSGRRL